jgi:thiamine kinase-like enzyme
MLLGVVRRFLPAPLPCSSRRAHRPLPLPHHQAPHHNDATTTTSKAGHISFIDYEYGAWSYRAYDIANHWCEWAGFACAWHNLPTPGQEAAWVRAYLRAVRRLEGRISPGGVVAVHGEEEEEQDASDEQEEEQLLAEARTLAIASHVYWGVWALVQARISALPFGYAPYAQARLARALADYAAWAAPQDRRIPAAER